MAQIIVRARVTSHGPSQWSKGFQPENVDAYRTFLAAAEDFDADVLVMSESAQEVVDQCQIGDLVENTLETRDSIYGRYIIVVDVRVIECSRPIPAEADWPGAESGLPAQGDVPGAGVDEDESDPFEESDTS